MIKFASDTSLAICIVLGGFNMEEDSQLRTATKLVQLGNAVTYFRNLREKEIGLTSVQSDAMRAILKNPGITAVMLKDEMKLSQSTMAGILFRLERKGIIMKSADKSDRRKAILSATKHGEELAEALEATALETQRELTAGMSDEEKAEFDRLLQIALDNMHAIRVGKEK